MNPMETAPFKHEDFDEAPSNIFVHKGAWATITGTNDKLAGWVDTHELFADHLYRDQILTKQYTNTREPGEFGDGVTVEREDESVVAFFATTASADKLEVVEHLSCGECQGSGYGGHPDSMVNCGSCNGRGAIPLVRQSDATRIITEQAERIAELERNYALSLDRRRQLQGRISRLQRLAEAAEARNAELVKALEPFALLADYYDRNGASDEPAEAIVPNIGDLRCARAALDTRLTMRNSHDMD